MGFGDRKQALVGFSPGVEEGRGGNADISYHLLAPAGQFPSKPLSNTLTPASRELLC